MFCGTIVSMKIRNLMHEGKVVGKVPCKLHMLCHRQALITLCYLGFKYMTF